MGFLGAECSGFLEVMLESLGFGEVGMRLTSASEHTGQWSGGKKPREPAGGRVLGAGNSAEV